ncbi:ring-hydroxylating dioxygenase subunit beta [Undibacterium sp. KW1]|uniref:aromatic-ring-hydroxylating dioxygenase subunit beta n=1 Tax=Undibacterium sp. KW1 TaxID=2058624 RepID=UPI001331D548|nr:aromatic-ring-hydroxylating dioxygenase subunit beta [Undibacterium sp. KW1]BBB62913.1 ring-hydroxylating dioxygenase subunit beta [Undibacterium sp. KW1]
MIDQKTYFDLCQLHANYASVVSNAEWKKWPDFFTDTCTYMIQPRENFERNFPLATLSFISKKMLLDRVYGIEETIFHDPYYQRNITGIPLVKNCEGGLITVETNYAVFRTKLNQETTVFNAGKYLDKVRLTPEGMKFESKLCIYDSEMIPNSLIYPI